MAGAYEVRFGTNMERRERNRKNGARRVRTSGLVGPTRQLDIVQMQLRLKVQQSFQERRRERDESVCVWGRDPLKDHPNRSTVSLFFSSPFSYVDPQRQITFWANI